MRHLVEALNRDAWLKEMFPDAAWPVPRQNTNPATMMTGANNPLDATASAAAIAAATGEDERVHVNRRSAAGAVRGGGAFGLGGSVAEPGTVTAGGRRGWASMEAASVAAKPVHAPPHNPMMGPMAGPAGLVGRPNGAGAAGVVGAGMVQPRQGPTLGIHNPMMMGAGGGGMMQQQYGAGGYGGGGAFVGSAPNAGAGLMMGGSQQPHMGQMGQMNQQQQQAMLYGGGVVGGQPQQGGMGGGMGSAGFM